jgi:hypothetical protein
MAHQRRLRFRVASTKSQPQSGAAHFRTCASSGAAKSRIADQITGQRTRRSTLAAARPASGASAVKAPARARTRVPRRRPAQPA